MNTSTTRRGFVAAASSMCATLPLGLVSRTHAAAQGSPPQDLLPRGFPSHNPDLVREVVGKSHFDFDAVKQLIEARPELAKVSWDWGFGDWETALGAASHVGRRDIAELLMAHGARPDIFTFAMFGQLDAVKAIIAAHPGIQRVHGPHGITLMAHAQNGGEAAAAVVDFLRSLGDADASQKSLPLDDATRSSIVGEYTYVFDGETGVASQAVASAAYCNLFENRGELRFKHEPDGSARPLRYQGDGAFSPSGSPHVVITIRGNELTIADGPVLVRAKRRAP